HRGEATLTVLALARGDRHDKVARKADRSRIAVVLRHVHEDVDVIEAALAVATSALCLALITADDEHVEAALGFADRGRRGLVLALKRDRGDARLQLLHREARDRETADEQHDEGCPHELQETDERPRSVQASVTCNHAWRCT